MQYSCQAIQVPEFPHRQEDAPNVLMPERIGTCAAEEAAGGGGFEHTAETPWLLCKS